MNITKMTAIALIVTSTSAFAVDAPNNYINTTDDGVIREIDHGGANYNHQNKPIIERDMATQIELDAVSKKVKDNQTATTTVLNGMRGVINNNTSEIYRVDQEDHRVVDATVNSDGNLVLHSEDMDGGTKREKVTNVKVGQDGTDGTDGGKGEQGVKGKDAISGLSLIAALDSIQGDGIGFGISKEEGSDFTFSTAVKFELNNKTNFNVGITMTQDGRSSASAGIGFSF